MFYAFCPSQDVYHCTDEHELEFDAEPTPRTFEFGGLRRVGAEHEEHVDPDAAETDRELNVCAYEIRAPDHVYESATLYVRFDVMENVEMFLNGGATLPAARKEIVADNAAAVQHEQYTLDMNAGSIFVVVVPV